MAKGKFIPSIRKRINRLIQEIHHTYKPIYWYYFVNDMSRKADQ